jgi:uncharacterized BrkB/YihY/UPF0761 family membrane protein
MHSTIHCSDDLSKAHSSTKSSSFRPGKNIWKKVLDLVLYLVACMTAGTGLLLAYRLPHGTGHASRVVFFGYGRHEWGDIHTWFAYFAIFLGVTHLALNWQWLMKVAASKHTWRLAAGILAGLLIVIGFLSLPVEIAERNRESDTIHLQIEQNDG